MKKDQRSYGYEEMDISIERGEKMEGEGDGEIFSTAIITFETASVLPAGVFCSQIEKVRGGRGR